MEDTRFSHSQDDLARYEDDGGRWEAAADFEEYIRQANETK